MPDDLTARLAALLAEHWAGGSAHVVATLTENGVGFVAEAERERDHLRDDVVQLRRELDADTMHRENPDACPVCTHMQIEDLIAAEDAADRRAERAEAALADLRTRVEALAEEWETAHGDPPVDPSHISVRHARRLRAALDAAGGES